MISKRKGLLQTRLLSLRGSGGDLIMQITSSTFGEQTEPLPDSLEPIRIFLAKTAFLGEPETAIKLGIEPRFENLA